ncbi:MAG TPA: hypothetical protein VFD39_12660 [Trueperaceae bacterium]|nr:hypothetical protein [Trueperaceae bacterium]
MLVRFGALMALVGLGLGALLRLVLGRRRFGLLVVIAHLPVIYHVFRVTSAGVRAELPDGWSLAFAGSGVALMLIGMLVGRASTTRRPWLAAAMPAIVAAIYLVGPALIYNAQLAEAVVALDSITTFAYVLATILMVAMLVPLAPPPMTGPKLPRMPWRR